MQKHISQLAPGMRITSSTNIRRGTWILPNSDTQLKTAAIVISGNDIVVDFGGATLRGTSPNVEPDTRVGTGIIIQGKNITVRNLKIHGYKVAIAALGAGGRCAGRGPLGVAGIAARAARAPGARWALKVLLSSHTSSAPAPAATWRTKAPWVSASGVAASPKSTMTWRC